MNVTFEEKDALNALLTIELNPADYQPKVDAELKKYRTRANIPGFRPGKAPMGVIKKMVGPSMLVDEINKLASESLFKHLEDNKIDVLGQPLASDDQSDMDFENPSDFTFKFDLGLAPKFDLNISAKDKLSRYQITIPEDEVEKEVDNNLRRFGKMLEIDKTEGDQDTVKGILTELDKKGESFEGGVAEKESTVLLEMVKHKPTQKALIGKKVGDVVNVDIFKFFNDNEKVLASTVELPAEGIKDLNKDFKLEITEVKRFEKATLGQDLYDQVLGKDTVKTEDEFKAKLSENIEQYYKSEAENQLDHSVSHLISDKHESISLPDAFLKRWLVKTYPDNYNTENIDELYGKESDQLRRQLIMEKVVAEFKLEVTQEDVNQISVGYTAQMLRQYGMNNPDLETIRYFEEKNKEDKNYMRKIGDIAIDRKVTDHVKTMITVKDKKIALDAFYKMIEKHNHEHNH
ncbi:MAG: trigger factor [Bacteroidetes bacterium]|nr:trigger factor [Bacteroidota bacterium]